MSTSAAVISAQSKASNAEIARRMFDELINQGNKAIIEELIAADATIHDPLSGVSQGRAAFAQLLAGFDTAFPHHRVEVHQIMADGEWVSVLHTHTAVHSGPFLGLPPTGRAIRVEGVEVMRIVDGKVVEFWRHDDDAGLLMQLGILPMPGG